MKGEYPMYLTIDGIEKSFPHEEKGQVKVLDNIQFRSRKRSVCFDCGSIWMWEIDIALSYCGT